MPNHHKHLSSLRIQNGQAMIEYAILLLLLVMIFVGGAEIGSTALASYKTTDAAKTAISEIAEINQRRLNSVNAIAQYNIDLAGLCPAQIYYKYDLTELSLRCGTDIGYTPMGNYSTFLQQILTGANTIFGLITLEDYQLDIVRSATTSINDQISNIDDNADGEITIDEIYQAEETIKNTSTTTTEQKIEKILKLINIELLKLRHFPLLTDTDGNNVDDVLLTEAKINIGDHTQITTQPSCPNNTGMPADQYIFRKFIDSDNNPRYYDNYNDGGLAVYLFNALPLDISSCSGTGAVANLIDGSEPPKAEIRSDSSENALADFEAGFLSGLPKLNQAMYGLYTRICVDAQNEYISCGRPEAIRTLLKPPGKICFPDGVGNADNCPSNPPDNITGFYRWGKSNEASLTSKGKVEESLYAFSTANELNDANGISGFRPTFQLDCSFQPNPVNDQVDDCDANSSKVRVHTRYRKVFEGFLTFGLLELATTNNGELNYFYNPNNVGVTNQVNSVAGSEIGPLGANQRPTVKYFRDFRGCYEVDVETNQVSACN